MPFFAYMLRCRDRSYYLGHTDDLERRVAQHHSGELPGYTHMRRPVELVIHDSVRADPSIPQDRVVSKPSLDSSST
jgi:predicted GIY-YIG superfamily endonuclease